MVALSKHIDIYSDGSYAIGYPAIIPDGYSLYQLKDDYAVFGSPRVCSVGGCPAQVPMLDFDKADVNFDLDMQMYLCAINEGMTYAAIMSLMGDTKVFMNGTGIGGSEDRNNYITGNIGHPKNPFTDKFRSMNLNTHLGYEQDGRLFPLALDGVIAPPMKTGKARPQRPEDAHMDDYLITPKTHPWFFIRCTNVKWKPDTRTLDYGPFEGGVYKSWMTDDTLQHTFFPFVTTLHKGISTPSNWWRKLAPGEPIPSAVRRG